MTKLPRLGSDADAEAERVFLDKMKALAEQSDRQRMGRIPRMSAAFALPYGGTVTARLKGDFVTDFAELELRAVSEVRAHRAKHAKQAADYQQQAAHAYRMLRRCTATHALRRHDNYSLTPYGKRAKYWMMQHRLLSAMARRNLDIALTGWAHFDGAGL